MSVSTVLSAFNDTTTEGLLTNAEATASRGAAAKAYLGIGSIKIGEKFSISHVEQTRRVITHSIEEASKEIMQGKVSELALMVRLDSEQGVRRTKGRRGAFALQELCWSVIVKCMDCVLSDIEVGGQDIMMGHSSSQFEIAVGDVPGWDIETHKALANVVGEHLAPQHGLLLTQMLHLPYQCPKRLSFQSQTDPVAVAQQYGSGRALRQFQSKGSEIVHKGMNIVVKSKASSAIM